MKPARSEQEFQSILRRLELALDASQIGVWEHNTGTDEVLWDLQMHRLYVTDTTQRKVTAAQWVDAIHPDDRVRAEQDFEEAIQRKGDYFSVSGLSCLAEISATSGQERIITRMAVTGHSSVQNGTLRQMSC